MSKNDINKFCYLNGNRYTIEDYNRKTDEYLIRASSFVDDGNIIFGWRSKKHLDIEKVI